MSVLEQLAPPETEADGYQVTLPDFYGPMDLLLELIEQEEMEITEISLAQVTDQYLAYVSDLKAISPDNLTDFLVVASKLLFIKSQVLLPRPPPSIIETEIDDTDDLVQQLRDYKRFKQLAQDLLTLETQGYHTYIRVATPPKPEPTLHPGEGNIHALLVAARRALTIKPEQPDVGLVVSRPEVTIGQQINKIRTQFQERSQLPFVELFTTTRSRVEVIVTFLAVLELLKRRLIDIQQEVSFGDIMLLKLAQADLNTNSWSELETLLDLS